MIWAKTVGPTILSGTSDVLLDGDALTLPAEAKSILAIIPYMATPNKATAGEGDQAKVWLTSDDFTVKPYEVFAPVGGSNLGAKQGIAPIHRVLKWPVNVPVGGGDRLKVYATGLIDHTNEPYVGATIIIADFVASPWFSAKVGTTTNTGTTAAEVKGTQFRITGAKALKKIFGYVVGGTVAASEGVIGKFRLSSSEFKGMGDVTFISEPIGGAASIDATTSINVEDARLTELDVDVPVLDPCDIDNYFENVVNLTNAGKWNVGVLYERK